MRPAGGAAGIRINTAATGCPRILGAEGGGKGTNETLEEKDSRVVGEEERELGAVLPAPSQ